MKHKSIISSFLFGLALSACVTINIYFPAAAAEDAARVIVRDVLNEEEAEVLKEEQETSNEQTNVDTNNRLIYVNFLSRNRRAIVLSLINIWRMTLPGE